MNARAPLAKVAAGALLALAPLVAFAPATARAERCAASAQAKALKERGDSSMEHGRPAEALPLYERAFDACHDPAVLYNLARVHLALADFPRALEYFERFDAEAPAELKSRVPGLAGLITEQRGKVTTVRITSNVPGARVRLREKTVGTTPLEGPLRVNAGKATLEVSADGYATFTREVSLPPGGSASFEAKLVARSVTGVLVVRSPVEEALVFVDGNPFGKVPIEHDVVVGAHRVLVRKDGYREAEREVTLVKGERKELTLTPEYIAPITHKWWFWGGVAAVVAAGVVTTVVVVNTEKSPDRGTFEPGTVVVGASRPLGGVRF